MTPSIPRRLLPGTVALALCMAVGLATAQPGVEAAESAQLASRFSFVRLALNSAPAGARHERMVAPGLANIRAWISAVGAAVGLTDLRGLGRAADACLVDPRDDSVTVLAVPGGGGPEYSPFRLAPTGLAYDATMAPMGCVPADVNADGAMDVLVYYWGRSPVMFLGTRASNPAPSAVDFRPVELVNPPQIWNTTAITVADVDGDGELDIAVGNYFPDGSRVLDPTAAGDGRMAMQDSMGKARNAGMNRLYLCHPTGLPGQPPVLTDASTAFPADSAGSWTLAFGMQDLTGDLLPELYVANDFGPDQLLVNRSLPGKVRFEQVDGRRNLVTPRSEVLGHDSFKGMGVSFSYDPGQRLPMIVVSNITTPYALHESNFAFVPTGDGAALLRGEMPYTERSEHLGLSRSGWAWDVKAGDFDNNGTDELVQATGFLAGTTNRWPELQELAMGNDGLLHSPAVWPHFRPGDDLSGHQHNPFWVRAPDGRYADVAPLIGMDDQALSRGLALGDIDGDGRLDVLVANQWQDSVLLRNTATGGAAADVRLLREGVGGGLRSAIGARLEWIAGGASHRAELYPANGHGGVSADLLHVAVPDIAPAAATATWRDAGGIHTAPIRLSAGYQTFLLRTDGTVEPR